MHLLMNHFIMENKTTIQANIYITMNGLELVLYIVNRLILIFAFIINNKLLFKNLDE
jgi:hypothetical protein